jgi:hypothetical protein
MAKRRTVTGSVAASVVAAAWLMTITACAGGGGESKPPETPATASKDPDEVTPSSGSTHHASTDTMPSSSDSAPSSASASGQTPYDKDAVEAQLKRGARSVKAACGAATDDEGQANGPWGKTTAKITLGRNGHVKGVTLPSPYEGTPVGVCVLHAFDKIQFPPYAGSSDVSVDWDVELVKPKH